MMQRAWLAIGLMAVCQAGCTICCSPFDGAYPVYGGRWERLDRFHGRVGSEIAPAGGLVEGDAPSLAPERAEAVPTPASRPEETQRPEDKAPSDDSLPDADDLDPAPIPGWPTGPDLETSVP